jgi:hypothetical protein
MRARCDDCQAQAQHGREAPAHAELRLVKAARFQSPRRPERYEEAVYECRVCASRIMHTTDANEFPPFWWFTN